MLERDVERKVVAWCKEKGIHQTKLMNMPGYPDRIFWVKGGKPVLIEFKRPGGGVVSPLQTFIHKQLSVLGYSIHIVSDADEAKKILTRGCHECVETT